MQWFYFPTFIIFDTHFILQGKLRKYHPGADPEPLLRGEEDGEALVTNEVDDFNEALRKGEGSSIPAGRVRGLLGRGH